MFTGIVRWVGTVESLEHTAEGGRLRVLGTAELAEHLRKIAESLERLKT